MLPEEWAQRQLKSVLDRIVLPVEVAGATVYREIGIRSHGKGIFHKPPITGEALGDKRVFWVAPDALVLNIVFAWEQAVAVTSVNETGMIASHRFPMYRPKKDLCDVEYLRQFFCTRRGKELLELASPGGAGRNKTLGQKEFEDLRIPMPGIEAQRRIASALQVWDDATGLANKLIDSARLLKCGLLQKLLPRHAGSAQLPKGWASLRIGDVVTTNPERPKKPVDGRVSFLPMSAVSEDGQITRRLERCYDDVRDGHPGFIDGDLLVAKITPCFENGKGTLAQGLINGIGFGSTEFLVLRPTGQVEPRLLGHILRSSQFRRRGASEMEGSAGQKRISGDFIRSFRFVCPRKSQEQRDLAELLDEADDLVDVCGKLDHMLRAEKQAVVQRLIRFREALRNS